METAAPTTGNPETAATRFRLARVPILLLLGLIAVGSAQKYREGFYPANETGRIHAAMAIVEHHSLYLEDVWDQDFPAWRRMPGGFNGDAALKDGHYLLDKPPGITLLMVPVVLLSRWSGLELDTTDLLRLFPLLVAALPSILFILAFGRWIRRNLGEGRAVALVAPAIVLASPWLLFCSQAVSHAMVASLTGFGVLLALGGLRAADSGERPGRRSFLGGLALGGAVLVESSSALVVLAVLPALLFDPARRRRIGFVILGGVAPALVFLTWNWLSFGGPLDSGYAYKVTPFMAEIHARGVYGLTWPGAEGFYGLFFSAKRGLFFLSPWLLVAPVGVVWACLDKKIARAWKVLLVLGVLLIPAPFTGYAGWHGGQTLGPRYIIFLLPLFGVAAAVAVAGLERARLGRWVLPVLGGLLLSSLLLLLVVNAGIPAVDSAVANPLAEVVLPVLLAAGPLGTVWDPLTGAVAGTAIAIGAALGMMLLVAVPSRGWQMGRINRRTAAALLLCAAVLHLATIPLVRTKEPPRQANVLGARWFSYTYMGRKDLSRALEPEIMRIERR